MKTLTTKCDRCGATEEHVGGYASNNSKLKLLEVGVAVSDPNQNYAYGSNVPMTWMKTKQEWCEKCRIGVGLIWQSEEQKKATPPPTLEEQLIEVLRCFVQGQIPQQ